jgi:hypothetical protein
LFSRAALPIYPPACCAWEPSFPLLSPHIWYIIVLPSCQSDGHSTFVW